MTRVENIHPAIALEDTSLQVNSSSSPDVQLYGLGMPPWLNGGFDLLILRHNTLNHVLTLPLRILMI